MSNTFNLLKLTTFGVKNIEKPVSLLFSNKTIDKGVKKFTNVKGVFGYNGSGKTALMTSILLYKRIVLNDRYLLQDVVTSKLQKLINKKTQAFSFDAVFEVEKRIIKHHISLQYDSLENGYVLKNETVEVCKGRTLEENWEVLAKANEGVMNISPKYDRKENVAFQEFKKKRYLSGSFLLGFLRTFLSFSKEKNKKELIEKIDDDFAMPLLNSLLAVFNINVFLRAEDKHDSYFVSVQDALAKMQSQLDFLKSFNLQDPFLNSEIVRKDKIENYQKKIARAADFIKLFKPNLQSIDVEKKEKGDFYQVNKIFVYKDYRIDFEFESSGIKHLVNMFDALNACAHGEIVFIDEMDANINSVYFQKLIEFFQKYGKGQLCFTSHDLSVMSSLKKQGKAITFLGEDCETDDWVPFGNRSPINEYKQGFIEHSPMNIEDFDFLPIFFADEKEGRE